MNYQKYKAKTLSQLKATAVRHFHKFIRERDKGKPCVSCGKFTTLQAGHFYSAGNFPETRFDEDNVHGQCKKCNYFLSGNLLPYKTELISRIGQDRFQIIENKITMSKRTRFKWDRFFLIEIIEKYKELNKQSQ
jgi:hypothetical protein